MKNKKGFTLIEIIICIAILAIVGTTGIVVMNNQKEKNNLIDYKNIILNAANVYVETNKTANNQLYNEKNAVYIPLRILVNEGLLDFKGTKVTEKEINENYIMKAFTSTEITPKNGECLDITTITSFDDSINSPTYICTSVENEEGKAILMGEVKTDDKLDLGIIQYILYQISAEHFILTGNTSYSRENTPIGKIEFVDYVDEEICNLSKLHQSNDTSSNATKGSKGYRPYCVEVSDLSSDYKIYAWLDSPETFYPNYTLKKKTLYIGTEDGKIYLNKNSARLFANLSIYDKINIENLDSSNVNNMTGWFKNVEFRSYFSLPKFDMSNVKDTSYMFYNTEPYEDFDINNIDTSNVENMNYMFAEMFTNNYNFLNSLNTEKATSMQGMFKSFGNVTDFNFSEITNFNTSNVEDMSFMFSDNLNLKTLDISNFNTFKVEDMSYMFGTKINATGYEPGLESITFGSDFKTDNVTNMRGMFRILHYIKDLNVSNFNTSKVEDMSYMFVGVGSKGGLKKLNVSNFVIGSTTNVENMFGGTMDNDILKKNKFLCVSSGNENIIKSTFTKESGLNISDFTTTTDVSKCK